jgi:histidinol dehydrogenase
LAIWLNFEAPDFEQRFAAFLTTKREAPKMSTTVRKAIIADVVARGDAALKEYSLKFDALDFDNVRCASHQRMTR